MRKKPRERGMQPLGRMLHKYVNGDKVVVKIDSGIHGGMPHPRYDGKVAIIMEQRGQSYVIEMRDFERTRELIVRPEHLRPYSDLGEANNNA